jgi:hypothetical protein
MVQGETNVVQFCQQHDCIALTLQLWELPLQLGQLQQVKCHHGRQAHHHIALLVTATARFVLLG